MAKYLAKELESAVYGNFRRVCTSRDIKLMPKKSNPEFQFEKLEYLDAKKIYEAQIQGTITWGYNKLETGFWSKRPVRVFKRSN
jgi:hypothetical protein